MAITTNITIWHLMISYVTLQRRLLFDLHDWEVAQSMLGNRSDIWRCKYTSSSEKLRRKSETVAVFSFGRLPRSFLKKRIIRKNTAYSLKMWSFKMIVFFKLRSFMNSAAGQVQLLSPRRFPRDSILLRTCNFWVTCTFAWQLVGSFWFSCCS